MTDSPDQEQPPHEMPPMGQGALSWGFTGFFILPVILIVLVYTIPTCAHRSVTEPDFNQSPNPEESSP